MHKISVNKEIKKSKEFNAAVTLRQGSSEVTNWHYFAGCLDISSEKLGLS